MSRVCTLSDDHRLCQGHPDHCGCPKEAGVWGDRGWHNVVNQATGVIEALEKCPAYVAGMKRRKEERARAAQPLLDL